MILAGENKNRVLESAIAALARTTGLKAHILPGGRVTPEAPDAMLRIETPQGAHTFLADIRAVDRFATPGLIKERRKTGRRATILVAPYITAEIAAHCKQLDLPFIDTAGNAYMQANGLFVYVVGQPRPADSQRDRFRALTAAGLQFTFAVMCRPALLNTNYRVMAEAARVALGTIGPAIKDLRSRGLLHVDRDKTLRIADPRRLLEEWVMRYPDTLRRRLNSRRFEAESRDLGTADLTRYHAYWGGEAAADRLTHRLRPAMFTIYAAGPWAPIAAAHRMRARPDGNVEILDAFWNFPTEGIDADLVPPPLVYADLLATGDARNVEAASLIYDRFVAPKNHPTG